MDLISLLRDHPTTTVQLIHKLLKYYSPTVADGKTFVLGLLCYLNNCVESIYKTQKTSTKVLPSATVGEQYYSMTTLLMHTVAHFESQNFAIFDDF